MNDEHFRELFCMILILCYRSDENDPGRAKMLELILKRMDTGTGSAKEMKTTDLPSKDQTET